MGPLSPEIQNQYDELANTIARSAEAIATHTYLPHTPEVLSGMVSLLQDNVTRLALWTPGYPIKAVLLGDDPDEEGHRGN